MFYREEDPIFFSNPSIADSSPNLLISKPKQQLPMLRLQNSFQDLFSSTESGKVFVSPALRTPALLASSVHDQQSADNFQRVPDIVV